MTNVCPGGGPSQPMPGAPINAVMTAATIDYLLGAAGLGVLIIPAAALEYPLINLPTFCAADRPTLPFAFQLANDAIALANPTSGGYQQAVTDFQTLVNYLIWNQFCQCVTGPQPTNPIPPLTLPTTTPVVIDSNPGWCVFMDASQVRMLNLGVGSVSTTPPSGWDQPGFNDSAWAQAVQATQTSVNGFVNSQTKIGQVGGQNPICMPDGSCMPQLLAPAIRPPNGADEFLFRWVFDLPSGFNPENLCISFWHQYQGGVGQGG